MVAKKNTRKHRNHSGGGKKSNRCRHSSSRLNSSSVVGQPN